VERTRLTSGEGGGHLIIPVYPEGSFGKFEDDRVYRADNLAAFGVGRLIAWKFLAEWRKEGEKDDKRALHRISARLGTEQGRAELTEKMEKVLREVFADNQGARAQLELAVSSFRKFQPTEEAAHVSLDALTFTPDYGGFNLNSLDRKKALVFQTTGNTIGWETAMWQTWKEENNSSNHQKYEMWRKEQFDNWTKYGGYKFPDAKYPK
jgi:hypothetical protein